MALVAAVAAVALIAAAVAQYRIRHAIGARAEAWYERWRIGRAPPGERGAMLERLAGRRHRAYGAIFRDHAWGPPSDPASSAAQRALIGGFPGSWPHQAHVAFHRLGGQVVDPTDGGPWEAEAWWDASPPKAAVPGSSEAWAAFLARWPRFIHADEAAVELARALDREGRPDDALAALDRALAADVDTPETARIALLGYLARAPEERLRGWNDRGHHAPETQVMLRQVMGWRRLTELDLAGADRAWGDADGQESQVWARARAVRELLPLERAWRSAAAPAAQHRAWLDLAEAILRHDAGTGAFFQLHEEDRRLGPAGLGPLQPELEAVIAESDDRATRVRARYLAAHVAYLRLRARCRDLALLLSEPPDALREVHGRFESVAEPGVDSPAAARAAEIATQLARILAQEPHIGLGLCMIAAPAV